MSNGAKEPVFKELEVAAGWNCYNWLIGTRKDSDFDKDKLLAILSRVRTTIHNQPNRTKYAMNNFIMSVGISYLPLHEEAKKGNSPLLLKVKLNIGGYSEI